jgi:uncharacterized protein YjiS (DUF1127 family)
MENEMSLSTLFNDTDLDVRTPVTNPVQVAFAAAARAVAAWRAERARAVALTDLLGMEPHRLRDLGINAYDVQQALQHGRSNRT